MAIDIDFLRAETLDDPEGEGWSNQTVIELLDEIERLRKALTRPQDREAVAEGLPNGALLIERRFTKDGHAIVLAFTGRFQPFATWFEARHPGKVPVTLNGHYFDDIEGAVEDFTQRVERGY